MALSGYIVLNYGFANVALRIGGLPVILGHALMFAGLTFALLDRRSSMVSALRDPAILSLAGLILLSVIHLCFDVPRYGLMAFRDASLHLEGVFILTGWLWGTEEPVRKALTKWLFAVFVANLLCSFTFPWAESITAWSPKSGIFLVVPIFGSYGTTAPYLLAGALFCLWVARDAIKLPNWVFWVLALGQVLGLALLQARSMYVAIPVVFVMLIFLRQPSRAAGLAALVTGSLVVLVLGVSLGIEVQGRIGPVRPGFLEEHAESLFLVPGSPAVGSINDREKWTTDLWARVTSSTTNLLVGEGFGLPLIDFQTPEGVPVRQPHNTSLSVLARLGLVGMLPWTLFHLCIIGRFLRTLRRRGSFDKQSSSLVLWLLMFYVTIMLTTSVQPLLEFSYGAIPFYFLMGFALRLMRRQLRKPPTMLIRWGAHAVPGTVIMRYVHTPD